MGEEEKPGSTRIIDILPEGSIVKKGDLVCTLDAAALEHEKRPSRFVTFRQNRTSSKRSRCTKSV